MFGRRVGGYLREDGFKVGCRDFLIENLLHNVPVHEGNDVVLKKKRVVQTERVGRTARSHVLLRLDQVADQAA